MLSPFASSDEVTAIVEDVHGATPSVSREMNRIAFFPESFPTPDGGVFISEIDVRPGLRFDRSGFDLHSEVSFLVDAPIDSVWSFFDGALDSRGWEFAAQDETPRGWETKTYHRADDESASNQSLTLIVSDQPNDPRTKVTADYQALELLDQVALDRLLGWYPNVTLPDDARSDGASVATVAAGDHTTIKLVSSYIIETGDAAEVATLLAAEAGIRDFTVQERDRGVDEAIDLDGPLDSFLVRVRQADDKVLLRISGSTKFRATAADTPAVAEMATAPGEELSDQAPLENIETIVNAVHGPTNDAAGELRRLSPFPDVPTPPGSSIVDLSTHVWPTDRSGISAVKTQARLRATGTKDEIDVFYEAAANERGWKLRTTGTDSNDGGVTSTTRIEYEIPGVDPLLGPAFEVTTSDDTAKGSVLIEYLYGALHPDSEARIERWLGWQTGLPLPDGGEPVRAGVFTDARHSNRQHPLVPTITYLYPDTDEATLQAATETLVPTSSYQPGNGFLDNEVYLQGDPFDQIVIGFSELVRGGTELTVDAALPLNPT